MHRNILGQIETECGQLRAAIKAHSHRCACFNQVKDIHDLYRIYGDWRGRAAVTLVLHDDHEEIAAGNLLYYK